MGGDLITLNFKHKFLEHDLYKLYKGHFETVKRAAESKIFDFIAHLDNMKVFNYRPDEALPNGSI